MQPGSQADERTHGVPAPCDELPGTRGLAPQSAESPHDANARRADGGSIGGRRGRKRRYEGDDRVAQLAPKVNRSVGLEEPTGARDQVLRDHPG